MVKKIQKCYIYTVSLQRSRSIGMTPEGMRKMFSIEALVIAGRPVLITLPLTLLLIWFMTSASYLNPMVFWTVAPIVPIIVFIVAIFGFVALAYYLGVLGLGDLSVFYEVLDTLPGIAGKVGVGHGSLLVFLYVL